MWLCFNNAFLSIVAEKDAPDHLLVRARRKGDIEAVFGPEINVLTIPKRDYRFRALLPRAVVAEAVSRSLMGIQYGNFKNSVRDAALHDAYATVWGVMAQLQEVPPYGSKPRPGFAFHPVR